MFEDQTVFGEERYVRSVVVFRIMYIVIAGHGKEAQTVHRPPQIRAEEFFVAKLCAKGRSPQTPLCPGVDADCINVAAVEVFVFMGMADQLKVIVIAQPRYARRKV